MNISSILKNKFFSNTLIYFISQIINKALPFLLIPLITRYLSPEQYGLVISFTAFLTFSYVFVGLSMNGAVNVSYFQNTHEQMKTYVFASLLILLVSALITSLLIHIFSVIIIQKTGLTEPWLYLAIFTALFQFMTLINLALWQAEQKAKQFGVYQIMQSLLITILTIVFIVGFNFDAKGVIIANVISIILFGFVSIIFLWRRGYIAFSINHYDFRDLLHFGVPMVPHQLSGWILLQYDKLFIVAMLGLSAAGIYAIGFQIGMMISILTLAFNKAWSPYLFKKLATNPSEPEKQKLVKYTYIYFFSILSLALIISAFSPYFIQWYVGSTFNGSTQVVGIITFAFAFNGMYFMVVNYLFYMKKTKILALITFFNSILYIATSYILLKFYGVIGVAYATLISHTLAFIIVWKVSNDIYPMPWFKWTNS